jgi:N-acetylglutamate synthase-like GNAT family acetyltransferase
MIRKCVTADFDAILAIVNDAAQAYQDVIPADCWHEPYMSVEELRGEIAAGIDFSGFEKNGQLIGVMGAQPVKDVTLIRHAYVLTGCRRQGIGARLLEFLLSRTARPVLVGTWAAASWAIAFYEKQGFCLVPQNRKAALLREYWAVPERQIEMSVVLADARAMRGQPAYRARCHV